MSVHINSRQLTQLPSVLALHPPHLLALRGPRLEVALQYRLKEREATSPKVFGNITKDVTKFEKIPT